MATSAYLTLNNGENRWTTSMVKELNAALDEVEQTSGPQALVTASSDSKFFSNGLDLDWITSKGNMREETAKFLVTRQ